MIRSFIFSFLFITFYLSTLNCQDYTAVDAHALSVSANGDMKTVAQTLVEPFTTEREQVRALFTWVTHHVRYDCKEFHRAPQDRRARTREQIVDRAFKHRLGVCAGYAGLFDALCEEVGIEAEVVSGYARKSIRRPNPARLANTHAWNAVKIDGEWHLLDATWGAGYAKGDCDRYVADFYDYYFLTPPEELIRCHWPEDAKWQLLAQPMTAEQYVDQPYFARLPDGVRIHNISPVQGTLSSDEATYDFRVEMTGGNTLAIGAGGKVFPMEQNEEGVFTLQLKRGVIRGRNVQLLYFRSKTSYKPIVTYQRVGSR